jgi:osmotically inducible protein OsmC
MAHFARTATASWKGSGPDGSGLLHGPSGVLTNTPYSAQARFQNEDGMAGTNPEELIAAAHAGCFLMALSFQLTNAGFPPTQLDCSAAIRMEKTEGGWAFAQITLTLTADVPGMDEAQLHELAQAAKQGCPVSKALASVPTELIFN